MSDSQSSAKNVKKPSQTDAAAEAADKQSASPSGVPYPVASEQPTVISSRPPILAPAVSDSVWRIMQGRIMPGDQIGHFELVEHVGGGGMGQVFRAIDTRLARTVALKILPPDQAVDAESLQRFQHEAQSAARLDHENIARVHYVGEDRGIHFIAFEFVEGENVRKLLERKGPLSLDEAIGYVLQLAEALAHADERHVVHRDIKPSNVLITPEGRVKLIDMGLARLRQIDPAKDDLTASGVTLGTFDYISPEQARDPRNTDIRSDIYSLGCTFYFMLTGRPPFAEGTVLQKLLQHHADPPPDVRQFRPDLPEETNRILQKMMAKDPRHRYLNPGELFADLILFVQQADLHPFSPGAGVWSPVSPAKASFFQRHLPWLSSIAALVLIVVMLDVFWSISSPREQAPPSLIFGPEEFVSELPDPQRFAPKTDLVATNTSPSVSNSNSFAENPPPVPIARSEQASQTSNTDNGSAAAEPGKNAPPAGTAAKHNGLLIVSDVAAGENEFTNLSAACAAARNDDVIELRYNGPREERPIRMANLRATIRPGAGYQPIILFRPNATDPVKYPRSMFSISSGRLTISNLSLEFVIPRDVPADNWSLMEIRSGQTIRLEKCSLTISNASDQLSAYHQDVAFFRVDAAPGADAMISGQNQAAPPLATIELNDTLARGEAIFLRVEDLQPVHLAWENGLLVTTEQLLWAAGGAQSAKPDEMFLVDLHHVTVVARGGLLRLASSKAAPHQFTVQLNSVDNIIVSSPGNPLIDQEVMGSIENARRQIVWNGDHNFYQSTDVFWTIRSLDAQPSSDSFNFQAWRKYWGSSRENQSYAGHVEWKNLPGPDRPVHAQTPADYYLDAMSIENPAIGAASDGRNVGMLPEYLIALPPNSESEK